MVVIEPSRTHAERTRQWTSFRILTAVLIPLLAIAIPAMIALRDNGPAGGAAASGAAVGDTPSQTSTPAAAAQIDGCLLGLWHRVSPGWDTIAWNNRSTPATADPGNIESWFFGADGTGTIQFALRLTGTSDSEPVEQTVTGTAKFAYRVETGTVLFTDGPVDGHVTTAVNGSKVDDTNLTVHYAPAHITCKAHKSLTLAFGGKDGTFGFTAPA